MIAAQLITEDQYQTGRLRPRRTVRLDVEARAGSAGVGAVVHNLSEGGLLLETMAELKVGEIFEIDLPLVGECAAEIMWSDAPLHGCRFIFPISKASVSAAQLLSPIDQPVPTAEPGGEIETFLDNTLPRPSDKVWYGVKFVVFLMVLAAALSVGSFVNALL